MGLNMEISEREKRIKLLLKLRRKFKIQQRKDDVWMIDQELQELGYKKVN